MALAAGCNAARRIRTVAITTQIHTQHACLSIVHTQGEAHTSACLAKDTNAAAIGMNELSFVCSCHRGANNIDLNFYKSSRLSGNFSPQTL